MNKHNSTPMATKEKDKDDKKMKGGGKKKGC